MSIIKLGKKVMLVAIICNQEYSKEYKYLNENQKSKTVLKTGKCSDKNRK
jgi:hypothetical protein